MRAGNDSGQWSGWRNSAAIAPFTPPPATPSSVTVTRSDGTLTVSGYSVNNAAKYHVTYSSNGGQSWTAASDNHAGASIVIAGVDNAKTYIVGVRAGNAAGWSGWRNSAAAGPYVTTPNAPSSVTLTRADGTVTASWPAVGKATKYHVAYSANNKQGWTAASDSHTGTSITIAANNGKTYYVAVRAGNSAGWSGWRNSAAAGPYAAPPPAAPGNLSVTPGDGYMDIAWNAVTGATGYDVKAKTSGAANWHNVAGNITTTSHRYTTSATIDYVGVRARNANGAGPWTELSRAPNENWLNTVQQFGGASLQMAEFQAQGQSQLAAPASITVTRENDSRDEKLYVSWDAVTGAEGYNLACAASPDGAPLTGWSWWHCGSVASGSTTSFTVDEDGRSGETNDRQTKDLGWDRAYTVAVRAVTSNQSDASPWLLSQNAHPSTQPVNITVSRADGSVSVSWELPVAGTKHTRGYEIECATRENNVTAAYTVCADVESATFTNRAITVTISSWTAGGTDYTIDNSKIYDLQVRHTNAWGESPWVYAPLIYVRPVLTVSGVGPTTATLTIAQHTGNWYYKADLAPDNTCQGPVSGTIKDLTGLAGGATYTYSAYSDSTCTTANLLTTAAQFTTQPSVSNLTSPKKDTFSGAVNTTSSWAVAFTTGSNAGGYTLKSFTAPLKKVSDPRNDLGVALHAMSGTGDYSTDSEPASTALSGATFSGTDPSTTEWADTAYTCTGSGCKLSPDTTYFVVLTYNDVDNYYRWAVAASAASEVEVALPSNNGWSIGYGHYTSDDTWVTHTPADIALAGLSFTIDPAPTTLSVGTISVLSANLTIANHTGSWYYKATTGPHTACQGPVSRGGQSVSGLTANTSYTYSAYSDSACTTLLATATAFTTLSAVSNLTTTKAGGGEIKALSMQAVAFTTGANSGGYTLKNVTLPLRQAGGTAGMIVELRPMDGTGTYSKDSKPTGSVLATLSGASPTSTSWNDILYTCSGSGCSLAANTTYFVVARTSDLQGYRWAYANSATDTLLPSGNGWSLGFDHYKTSGNEWSSWETKNLARVIFSTD